MLNELREDMEAIQALGLGTFLYHRFVYRHHMQLIHARGGHKLKHYGPLYPDGGSFDKCEWCGHMENIHGSDLGITAIEAERMEK